LLTPTESWPATPEFPQPATFEADATSRADSPSQQHPADPFLSGGRGVSKRHIIPESPRKRRTGVDFNAYLNAYLMPI
jgi:hypothetical protein